MKLTSYLAVICSLYGVGASRCWPKDPETYTCCAVGDPHYYTFDGKEIDFQGTCKYLLAGTCPDTDLEPFHVYVDNDASPTNPSVSITRVVEIHISGHVIVFSAYWPHITINGNVIPFGSLPYNIGGVGVVRSPTNIHYEFISFSDVFVTYSQNHDARVTVPSEYREKMRGICGNMNDDITDDLTTCDNVDTTEMTNSYNLIGYSWQVPGGGDKCEPIDDTNCKDTKRSLTKVSDDYIPPILEDPKNCAALLGKIRSPIIECVDKFLEIAMEYYNLCLYDFAASGNLCDIIGSFVDYCHRNSDPRPTKPVAPEWREFFDCPIECPPTMVYTESVPACPRLCQPVLTFDPEKDCEESLGEGCTCPKGWYLQMDICVEECMLRG